MMETEDVRRKLAVIYEGISEGGGGGMVHYRTAESDGGDGHGDGLCRERRGVDGFIGAPPTGLESPVY